MLPVFFHQTPFFRFLLPFIAGIVAGFHFAIPATYCLAACACFLAGMCWLFWMWKKPVLPRWRLFYGVLLNLFLLVSGIGAASLQRFAPSEQAEHGLWLAVVDEPPVEREKSVKATVHVQANLSTAPPTPCDEKVIVYFRKDDLSRTLWQGDLLVVDAMLKPVANAGNPYEFDYRGYLVRKHIGRSAFVESGKWQRLDNYAQSPLTNFSNRIRTALLDIFRHAGLEGNELAVAEALVLGYKADLDDALRGAYCAAGATHVLAVSGLHVGIIYIVLVALLKLIPFLHRTKWLRALIAIVALWLYALITGMSPSVMRAVTMFSFVAAGEAIYRKTYIYNSIAASAFVLLLANPANLFDVGFQLSYLAVISIVFFHRHLYGRVTFKDRIPDYAWNLTCTSVAAQIGTAPLTLYYFHQFPVYFILSGFVVIPAASVIIYGALFLFAVSPVAALSGITGWLLDKFLYLVNSCIFAIEKFPGSVIWGIRFQEWEIFLSCLLIAAVSAWALTARKIGLFATLAVCLLWVAGSTVRLDRDLRRQQLTVYHAQGNSLLQFVDGHDNAIWYAGRNMSFDAPRLAENQRIAMHLDEPHCLPLDSALHHVRTDSPLPRLYVNGNFIQFAGKRIAIFTRNRTVQDAGQQTVRTDIVILAQNPNVQIRQIIRAFNPGLIVVDASNAPYRTDRWERDCLEAGIRCHRIDRDGAFVLSTR